MPPRSYNVYDLVESSRIEVLGAIASLEARVVKVTDDHEERLRGLETEAIRAAGRVQGEARVMGMARTTFMALMSVAGAFVAVAGAVAGHRP